MTWLDAFSTYILKHIINYTKIVGRLNFAAGANGGAFLRYTGDKHYVTIHIYILQNSYLNSRTYFSNLV